VGIEGASHDIIVVTDADCKPANTLWLQTLVSEFMRETDFVLGYAPFNKTSGLLNKFIRFDNVMAAMQYFGFFAGRDCPYMGVGRNMAFRKKEFLNYEESEKSKKILSGDDDLFINKKATRATTEIAIHKDSFMFSNAKETWERAG
jgi:cellulose synthase/poly-beta-1,6-N-acetylglucosamine synthase-like glycosyltransferase